MIEINNIKYNLIENYKEGRKYYDICSKILEEAKQLIEIYDRETDTLKEMEI